MYIIFRRKPMGFPHLHGMPWLFRHSAPRLPTAADKGLNLGVPTSSMQITLNILILIIYTWSYVIYIYYIIIYIYIYWLIYICSHMWHMWSYVYHVTWLPYEVMDQRGSFYASLVASHCVFQSQRGQGLPIKGLSMTRTLKVLPGSPGEVGQFSKRIAPPENILNIIKHY